jgi:hypothetical protein
VIHVLLTEPGVRPDHVVVPILTVTLLDVLIDDLLVNLCEVGGGMNRADAQTQVEALRNYDAKKAEFKSRTGHALSAAVGRIDPKLWDRWELVRHRRNTFVHGNPYALGWDLCKDAHEISMLSVSTFSSLTNTFLAVSK